MKTSSLQAAQFSSENCFAASATQFGSENCFTAGISILAANATSLQLKHFRQGMLIRYRQHHSL